jgi:hypothetical protein
MIEAIGSLRRMNTNVPTQKITIASVAGALVTLVAAACDNWLGQPLPASVVAALTTIAAFAAGYLAPPGKTEQVIRLDQPKGDTKWAGTALSTGPGES